MIDRTILMASCAAKSHAQDRGSRGCRGGTADRLGCEAERSGISGREERERGREGGKVREREGIDVYIHV